MSDGLRTMFRLAAAALFAGAGALFLRMALGAGGGMLGTAVILLAGFAMWLLAAVCLSPTVAGWFSAPWANLYFPSATNAKPPPHYSLAEAKVKREDFEGALALYVQMTLNHPQEAKPYCDMIDVILHHLKDPERAAVVYQEGMATLKDAEGREVLERRYRAALSRAAGPPAWGKVHTVAYQEEAAPDGYRDAPEQGHVPNPLRTSKEKRNPRG
jgi:hypothetical protein